MCAINSCCKDKKLSETQTTATVSSFMRAQMVWWMYIRQMCPHAVPFNDILKPPGNQAEIMKKK